MISPMLVGCGQAVALSAKTLTLIPSLGNDGSMRFKQHITSVGSLTTVQTTIPLPLVARGGVYVVTTP